MSVLKVALVHNNVTSDVEVIAAVVVIAGKMEWNNEQRVALPQAYTEEQAVAFETTIGDNAQTVLVAGVGWLNNGGILQYSVLTGEWVYQDPLPTPPVFVNTGAAEDLTSAENLSLAQQVPL